MTDNLTVSQAEEAEIKALMAELNPDVKSAIDIVPNDPETPEDPEQEEAPVEQEVVEAAEDEAATEAAPEVLEFEIGEGEGAEKVNLEQLAEAYTTYKEKAAEATQLDAKIKQYEANYERAIENGIVQVREAEVQRLESVWQAVAEALPALSPPDPEMEEVDPDRYARRLTAYNQSVGLRDKIMEAAKLIEAERKQADQEKERFELRRIQARLPELFDPVKKLDFETKAVKYIQDNNLDPSTLQNANADVLFLLRQLVTKGDEQEKVAVAKAKIRLLSEKKAPTPQNVSASSRPMTELKKAELAHRKNPTRANAERLETLRVAQQYKGL